MDAHTSAARPVLALTNIYGAAKRSCIQTVAALLLLLFLPHSFRTVKTSTLQLHNSRNAVHHDLCPVRKQTCRVGRSVNKRDAVFARDNRGMSYSDGNIADPRLFD